MKKFLLCFAVFALLLPVSDAHATKKQLHVGISTGYPPFYFFAENQQPTGIFIDVLEQIAAELGLSIKFSSYPWKRMLQYGKDGKVDAVMPLFQTPEREQFLRFPKTALIDEENRFFTAATSTLNYSGQLSEIANHKIAVVDGFSYGSEFDRTEFSSKTIVQTTEQLILLVRGKRVDFGIGNPEVIRYTEKQMHVTDNLRFLSPPVTVAPLFIGFSKAKTEPEFVARFNQQLQQMKQTERFTEIVRSYGGVQIER